MRSVINLLSVSIDTIQKVISTHIVVNLIVEEAILSVAYITNLVK